MTEDLSIVFRHCAKLHWHSIIAVHGLNGHAYGTWAHHEEGKSGSESMWLRDFIPEKVPKARILVHGYNSALLGSNTSVSSVKDFAHDLLHRIIDDRANQVRHPILFRIHAHSLRRVAAFDLYMPLTRGDRGEAGRILLEPDTRAR